MMSDQWTDGEDPVVDFSGDNRAKKTFKDRSKLSEYGDIDLASGFPSALIWTTKDGRRIAIPNITDDHLLNILAYVRRHIDLYKGQIAVQMLSQVNFTVSMFDFLPEHQIDAAYKLLARKGKELYSMTEDEFFRKYMPIYSYMYQEAYKRKILIEVDSTKITQASEGIHPLKNKKPTRKVKIKKPELTFDQLVDQWAQGARDTDGVEVPRGAWEVAEAVVKKYPTEFGLGSARGPDKSWKRLFLHEGSGNT